jgi:hypothetical protein
LNHPYATFKVCICRAVHCHPRAKHGGKPTQTKADTAAIDPIHRVPEEHVIADLWVAIIMPPWLADGLDQLSGLIKDEDLLSGTIRDRH